MVVGGETGKQAKVHAATSKAATIVEANGSWMSLPSSCPCPACCTIPGGRGRSLPVCGQTPRASESQRRQRSPQTPTPTTESAASLQSRPRHRAQRQTIPDVMFEHEKREKGSGYELSAFPGTLYNQRQARLYASARREAVKNATCFCPVRPCIYLGINRSQIADDGNE